jgi:hypothetical protein
VRDQRTKTLSATALATHTEARSPGGREWIPMIAAMKTAAVRRAMSVAARAAGLRMSGSGVAGKVVLRMDGNPL